MCAMYIERKPETVEFTRTDDGKYALIFDELPLFLFVSTDGTGSYDQTFVNGKWLNDIAAITIESKMAEVTRYSVDKYVCVNGEETE
ncbi:hypothetical protein [Aneurinibacillus migulanus]|uniref:hypothetical protein n=1 Tax=Aneurinibacillus migulanus TaxID=47500 RepID=UPI00209E7CA7|nr:hypothetical protein [Aneurinibacillus migulanus]MCP1354650.1 hypothetical protein [Aneurinibacillus migulanus]